VRINTSKYWTHVLHRQHGTVSLQDRKRRLNQTCPHECVLKGTDEICSYFMIIYWFTLIPLWWPVIKQPICTNNFRRNSQAHRLWACFMSTALKTGDIGRCSKSFGGCRLWNLKMETGCSFETLVCTKVHTHYYSEDQHRRNNKFPRIWEFGKGPCTVLVE
jgi:hypothetical protein